MDKINYSKNAWEDGVIAPQNIKRRVLPWRSYFSQRKRITVMGGMPHSVHGSAAHGRVSLFTSKGLEPKLEPKLELKLELKGRTRPKVFLWLQLGIIALSVLAFSWSSGFVSYRGAVTAAEYSIPAKPLSPEEIWQNWKDGLSTETSYLERNEALVFLLKRYGLSQEQSSDLVLSVKEDVDLNRLRKEKPIQLFFTKDHNKDHGRQLVGFQLDNKEKTVNAYLYQGKPKNEIEYHELSARAFQAVVKVERSLYQDGIDQGIPGGILLDMFNRYSFDINFQSDIQRGTRYEIIYTMIHNEKDERVDSGEILYANIVLANNRSFPIFRYTDISGKSEFFNPQGRSVNKALLLMPVNGAYVSSNFGYRRDPIFGTWRLHRGTDYAAPRGTPIKAGGTGTIIKRGWSRAGYGYHMIIRHVNGYDTLYGHMSRFQPGYRVGSKVRQGNIIGYVGSTGKSTGPHVHYEVRRYGRPIGLKSLRLQSSRNLAAIDKRLFESRIRALQARFKGLLPDLQDISSSVNLVQKERTNSGGIGGAEPFQ